MGAGRRSGCWNGSCSGAAIQYPLYNPRYTIPARYTIPTWPPPKRDFGPKRRFGPLEAIPLIEISNSGGPFQKWKSDCSAPATRYTIPAFPSRLMLKVLFQRNPRPSFHVATPPFSSISFLLTVHARNAPPSTVEAVWVCGWRFDLGG